MLKDYFEVPNKPAVKSGNILSCDFTDHETFIPQPLDYSRGTIATYVDCNGLIKMSGVSDTELVTNGDFATDSNWAKGSGWSINNGKASVNTTTINVALTQDGIITVGKTYKVVYEVKDFVAGSIRVRLGDTWGSYRTANGTYTEYLVPTTNTDFRFYATAATTELSIDNVSAREIDIETPRIDYTTEIGKAKELQKPSLLLENESTNLFLFSENFTDWNGYQATSNSTTAPDGSSVLFLNFEDARMFPTTTISNSTEYTASIYLKANKVAQVKVRNARNIDTTITLTTDWVRYEFTATSTSTSTNALLIDARFSSGLGAPGLEIALFGAQLEEELQATSYIPTSGSTVTRNRETARLAGQLGVFNSQEGTLYAEFASLGQMNISAQRRMGISDNTNNNRATITISNGNPDRINFVYRAGGANQFANTLPASLDITNMNKFAFTWKQGEYRTFYNGQQHNTGNLPTVNTVSFDNFGFVRNSTTDRFYGRVRGVKVFRRALTFEELTELTNNIV